MKNQKINDKLVFYILSKLGRYGHEKLPLEIVKDKQSYVVGHRRKHWNSDEEFIEEACEASDINVLYRRRNPASHANTHILRKVGLQRDKITYVKSRNYWKLFWKRADLKWHLYEEYDNLDDLLEEVRTDPNGCFWG